MGKKSIRLLNSSESLNNIEEFNSNEIEVIKPNCNSAIPVYTPTISKGMPMKLGALPIPVIDGIINIFNNAINAFKEVAVEREKTKQVREQATAFIEGQREETNRVRVVEEATTKRYEMQITSEIERAKLELIKQKNAIEAEVIDHNLDHQRRVLVLQNIQNSITAIIEQHKAYGNMLNVMFNEVVNNNIDIDDFCKVASKLNEVEKNLLAANEKLELVVTVIK